MARALLGCNFIAQEMGLARTYRNSRRVKNRTVGRTLDLCCCGEVHFFAFDSAPEERFAAPQRHVGTENSSLGRTGWRRPEVGSSHALSSEG